MGLNQPLRGPNIPKIKLWRYLFIPRRSVRSPGSPGPLKHQKKKKNLWIFLYFLGPRGVGGLGAALFK